MTSADDRLAFHASYPLRHDGDVLLLGVTAGQVYIEEVYGDGWLAQHAIALADGTVSASVDEAAGSADALKPLDVPADAVTHQVGWQTMRLLNYGGARHRGLSAAERIVDLVLPLTPVEKMTLNTEHGLPIPPLILGVAESYVLAEAPLVAPDLFVVCRRVRIAYRLPEAQTDADGLPYDYDTHVVYTAHTVDLRDDRDVMLFDATTALGDAALFRPMDCVIGYNWLIVADGGAPGKQPSAVHVWRVGVVPPPDDDTLFLKKLYG